MRRIASKIWSHNSKENGEKYSLSEVLKSRPAEILKFRELVKAIADLSYHNPEQVLFFRGQTHDFRKKNREGESVESFYPTIYRSPGKPLTREMLQERFKQLEEKSLRLRAEFKAGGIPGHDKLAKFPELTWAILQHYEVCPTPLLDMTNSLRVAASIALNESNGEGYLYVFGFPHPNGSITYSVELELINIRLLSICPPEAQRPYFQEGFLVGTFPTISFRRHPNLDIGARLIAKYKLLLDDFWDKDFHAIPNAALYPTDDQIWRMCAVLKNINN